MVRLAAILIVLVLACLVTVGYPVFAQVPPEQESGGVSSAGKSDSGISQLLLDSINERGRGGTQQAAVTRDAVTRDSTGSGKADAGVVGSSGATEGGELLSEVSKDDFETSQTVGDLVRFDRSGNVEVYIHLKSTDEASLQQVRDAVEKVEIEGAEYGLVQAWVDPDNLGAVANLEAVKRITPPDYGYTKKGSTLTEGDAVHRANLVRAFSGLSGEGVKVGVISDGVDAWTSARSRGDLPSRIEINPNQDSEGHEGTALLEIIHDLAPDAELAFSGSESSLGMAQAILWLANDAFEGEGADVIVDDLGYYFQPFFEDGIVAQAAADAVAGGAVFASAAGNHAQEHYEGDFVDGGDGFHAFDGSSDITMRLRSPFSTRITLQWNDKFGASGNDYDLYICPAGLTPTAFNLFNRICDASADTQNGNDDPLEVASLYGEDEVDVFIKKDSGQNRRLEMFFFDSYAREYGVEEGGIVHHVAVPGVLAVGAVDADDPGNDDLRSYSDQGPSRIYFPSFETRQKPDAVASDGVSVTGSGGFPSHFNGTSAAAPHVAGIAALLVEAQRLADPTMTKKQVVDAVTQKIRDTAIDLGPSGHDYKFGYGRADALAAVESLDQLSGTTFTVNSAGDGADNTTSDGVCDDGNGNCTLRAAIQEANRVDGSFIEFNISGSGTRTIQPASALPTIGRTVFIDGFSQSGASSTNYRIELDGTNAGTNANGLTISGTESWVRGLVINRFGGNGIVLQGSGGKQVIEENRIGTDVSGSGDSGNGKSGMLVSGADGVKLGNNLISGNDSHGVEISGGGDYAIIEGNIIGANASGTSDLGNTGSGIHISNGDGATIGDNVIAGNDSHGVALTGSSTYDNVVGENYIGVNENGSAIANSGSGVHIDSGARDNTIEHNTIANNTGDGVTVVSSSSTDNTVWENSIYSNGGLGIDLNDDGVTANDANDPDSGPNNLQNYAVLTSAGLSSDVGSIGFNLYVEDDNRYTVDFYASNSCDGSGNGEGKEWLGFARVVPTTFGARSFVVNTFKGTLNQYDQPSGTYITATVTLDGSTSEFSPCIQSIALPRLTLSEDAIEVEEDGTTSTTYTVRLATQPSHDATVDLSIEGDDVVTVSPSPLTFTTGNWFNARTVTVTTVSDADPEDEFTVVQHKLTIDSKQYVSEWLTVAVQDDDVPDLALVIGGNHRVTGFVSLEEGQFATYPVVLTEEPDVDVTVRVYSSSSSALRVLPSLLTLTKDEYDTPQDVTITALVDSDAENELVNVYHEVLIDGSYYEVARVRAFINDPIFPALILSTPTLSVNEGETASYTLVPEAEPSRSFTLTLESSDTESVTVSPPNVTFTRGTNGNWQTPQTIMVIGVQDDDEFDDVATILHKSTYSGVEYFLGSGVAVTVADGNRAPYLEEGLKTTRTVPENSPQGTNVGEPVVATDLNGDSLTYTIEDQIGGPYAVDNSGQITVGAGANLDYESRTAQEVKLKVQDTDGLSDTIEVQIEITDVNEPPVVTGDDDPEFAENRTGSIDRYSASDPERESFTWSVGGADGSFFSVDSRGYLSFMDPPDFEDSRGNIYNLTVVATDTGGMAGGLGVKITVTNVNEAPTVRGRDELNVNENDENFGEFYFASDPEGSSTTFAWSLSGSDGGDFNIDRSTGELTFRNTPNYESPADSNRNNEYLVTVRAYDGQYTGSLNVTIIVNDVNEAPTITGDSEPSFPEESTGQVARYQAADPERRTINWLVGGPDGNDFRISETGALTFASPPDYESPAGANGNEYLVTVRARDDGFNFAMLEVTVTVTAVNEPPTVTGDIAPTVDENSETFSRRYNASDPEGVASTFTWSLSGTDGGDFNIDRSTGELTFRNTPNYESPADSNRNNEYLLTVMATDEGGLRGSLAVTVTVNDVNEVPKFTSSSMSKISFTYPENSTSALYTYQATDPERGTITWSVSGTDDDDFDISETGVLTFANVPDFENPVDSNRDNEYLVTVQARDDGFNSVELEVTVNVTNSTGAEEPTITTTSSPALTYQENGTGTVYTFRATDPQRGAISWSVTGADADDFDITSDSSGRGVLTFSSPPDFEKPTDADQDNVYEITVVATDEQGLTDRVHITVTVTNDAEGVEPTISTRRPPTTYRENRTSTVYTFRASDPQRQILTWSLEGDDRGDFDLSDTGAMTFISPPDFESPVDDGSDNEYELTVIVSDEDGNADELSFTIIVTDVNEGPEVTSGGASFTVQENQEWAGASFTASDPEGGAVTRWNLGGRDGGDFTISNTGALTFRNVPDYDRPDDADRNNVYEVEIRPYDGRYYGSHDVKVTVEDVNEVAGPSTLDRAENFEGVLATYTATGRGDLTIAPSWRLTGADGGDFTISEQGELTFRSIPDYERPADSNRDNEYVLTVQVSDGRYYGTLDVAATVSPVNEAPTITTFSRSATELRQNENQASRLYTYNATDPEGATISWSVGGTDGRFFTINERGQFSFKETNPPNFELPSDSGGDNVYDVLIQAEDDGFNTASLPVTVTVREVNEGPEVTIGQSIFTINENQDLPNAFYTGFDPEGGTVSRWTGGGRDGGDFNIGQDGRLTFRSLPDYERPADANRDNVYELEVRPYDGRYYGSFAVTVTVTDVNEPPEIRRGSTTSFTQPENRTSRLYSYSATDPERGTVSWSVGGTDGNLFTIDERGQFSFKETNPPDFDAPGDVGRDNLYNVTIQARDPEFNTASLPVTVTVTEVNEGPVIARQGSAPGSVPENQAQNMVLARYTATDPEGGTVSRWGTSGTDGGDFVMNEQGELRFRYTPDYERPADGNRDNIYVFTVRVSDGSNYGSFDETVTVTAVNEPPTITTTSSSATGLRQPENRTSRLYTYSATDPERGTVRWSVGGTDGNFFAIDERGQFSFSESSPPNFEQPGDSGGDNVYNVTIQAADEQGVPANLDVTVAVTDVNEGPEVTSGGDSFTVQENQEWAGASFTASDPEEGTVTRWNLGGRDGARFIISESGVLTFRDIPDYERPVDASRDNVYEVEIRPYDGRYYGSHDVKVSVEDVDEISGPDTLDRSENFEGLLATYSAIGRGDLTVAPTWRLTGTDSGDFAISEQGELTFRSTPDHERPADSNRDNAYNFAVQASDGRYYDSHDVTVTVNPVDEAPEIRSGSRGSFSQPENRSSRLYIYSATDPEGGTVTWSAGGTDGNFFTINERGEFSFNETSPPDFEARAALGQENVYTATVQASDGTHTASLPVTVTVTDVNEGPEVMGPAQFSIAENQGLPNAVYTARDPEGANVALWSVAGRDGGDFFITQGGTLAFRYPPDYEGPADSNRDNRYEVSVQPSDGRNTGSYAVTVTVTDVNEPPEIKRGSTTSFTQPENQVSTLYTFRAIDPEGSSVMWSVGGADGSKFTIDERGALSFTDPPDFDSPGDVGEDNVYNVTVQASDGQVSPAPLPVTVTVTEVNEGPVIARQGNAPGSVPENQAQNMVLARYTALDPERPNVKLTQWSTSGRDGGDFVIDALGQLRFRNSPDYERPADSNRDNVYEVTIRASDGRYTSTLEEIQTVTVTNVNEAPTITTSSRTAFSQPENRVSTLYTFRATDPEGGILPGHPPEPTAAPSPLMKVAPFPSAFRRTLRIRRMPTGTTFTT